MDRKARLRLALVLLVTGLFLVLFLRDVHWDELRAALAGVRPGWIALAVALSLGDYLMRGVRWMVLVRHVDAYVRLDTLWRGTAIGAALNTFVPLRGGDLVRPAYVASKRGIPFTTLLSTTVVEKLLDLFGVVVALVAMLALLPPALVDDPASVDRLRRWGAVAGVLAVGGLGLLVFLATRRAREAMMLLMRPWPYAVKMRVMRVYLELAHGLEAGGHPLRLVPAVLATVALWSFTAAMAWASFHALGVDASAALGLFVAIALTVTVSVPQAPGFLGLFQVVTEQAAVLWGVSEGVAEAEALVLWAVYIVPITVVGMVYGTLEGRGLLGFRRQVEEQAEKAVKEAEEAHRAHGDVG